jgi:hypothetical protein
VAAELVAAASEGQGVIETTALEDTLAAAVEAARSEGRPVERSLLTAEARRRRLTEALAWTIRSGVAGSGPRALRIDAERVAQSELLARSAREYASARER